MDISVIIPTHNRAKLLERALRSVHVQSRRASEVIVVDDGSTDSTREGVSSRFPQVQYIWQPNRGVSAARNRGLRAAHGEWLAFLDSDDEWLPQKLQAQQQALQAQPRYKVCHTDEIWIRHGTRVNPGNKHAKSGGAIFRRCLPLCVISPSSVIIHRSVFADVELFDEALPACEDYDLWLRICAVYPVLLVNQPLIVKYGGHADQLSRRYPAMDRFRIAALEKIIHSGKLSVTDRQAALQVLLEKIGIYLQGAIKRSKHDDVARYRHKHTRYAQLARAACVDGAIDNNAPLVEGRV